MKSKSGYQENLGQTKIFLYDLTTFLNRFGRLEKILVMFV